MLRKLIGINIYIDRDIKMYEKTYALVTESGHIETLRELYISETNYLRKSLITDENPYELDFDFLEDGHWEVL